MLSSCCAGQSQMAIMKSSVRIEGLVVELMAMASAWWEAAWIARERWRQGLWDVVFRIQCRLDIPLTCTPWADLLVGVEERRRSSIGSVTSIICRSWWQIQDPGRIFCNIEKPGRHGVVGERSWTRHRHQEHRLGWLRKLGSYIIGLRTVEQPECSVIALWVFSLLSGCVICRVLLALVERRESQTHIGIGSCLEDTSNASWVGRRGWLKGTLLGLVTPSIF